MASKTPPSTSLLSIIGNKPVCLGPSTFLIPLTIPPTSTILDLISFTSLNLSVIQVLEASPTTLPDLVFTSIFIPLVRKPCNSPHLFLSSSWNTVLPVVGSTNPDFSPKSPVPVIQSANSSSIAPFAQSTAKSFVLSHEDSKPKGMLTKNAPAARSPIVSYFSFGASFKLATKSSIPSSSFVFKADFFASSSLLPKAVRILFIFSGEAIVFFSSLT